MRRCIYCLEDKEEPRFNREHVIPQAFGVFDSGNLVLDCVCKDCNSYFDRELDLKFARDSAEGFDRIRTGLKPATEFKGLGRRSTTRVELQEGSWKGALVAPRRPESGTTLDLEPIPQVGFSSSPEGPFTSFPLDELPTKEELVDLGFERGSLVHLRLLGAPREEIVALLASKGFGIPTDAGQTLPPSGPVYAEFVFKITHPEFRVVTKIAMNYLARVAGPGIASMPQFNEARQYVRHDQRPRERLVSIIEPVSIAHMSSGSEVHGHFIAVERQGDLVLAQVSLLGRFRYLIRLSDVPFVVEIAMRSCHVFDLDRRVVDEAEPPSI